MNVDDIGYERESSAYSFYEFPPPLENHARELLRRCDGFIAGERWSNGDYMVFVQNGVPALAFTSECMLEFMHTRAHTRSDTPEIVDYGKLVQVANAIGALMRSL